MKSKKIFISLGAITAVALPASTVLSCSYEEEINQLTNLTINDIKGQLDLLGTLYGDSSVLSKKQTVWDAIFKFFTDDNKQSATIGFNNNAANNHQYDKFIGIYIKLYHDIPTSNSFDVIIISIWTVHYKFQNKDDLKKEIPKAQDWFDQTITIGPFKPESK